MEIKVGEYVRTECGIAKVKNIEITDEVYELDKDIMYVHQENWKSTCSKSEIVKHSKNIIDLIEVGDIVEIILNEITGKTTKVYIANKEQIEAISTMNVKMLATILTHEQYNAICYKVKGE